MENLEILGKTMWIIWGNYCGLGWIIVDKSPGGFHKSRIGGKCGRIMCIKKSTLILRWREFNLPKIARLFVLSQGEKLISLPPPKIS